MNKKNIFQLPTDLPLANESELFDLIFQQKRTNNKKLHIERIVSTGQQSPADGTWYDQDNHEWVILLEGEATLMFEEKAEAVTLQKGDYLHIPPHCRHRVIQTSEKPPCVWLAIHF